MCLPQARPISVLHTDHQVADIGCGEAIRYLLVGLALLAATLRCKYSV